MRRVTLAGLALIGALLLAIPSAFAQVGCHGGRPGDHGQDDQDRRDVPAVGTGLELRRRSRPG